MDEHGSAQERFSHGSWRRGAAGPAGISGVQQQPYYGRPLRQQGGAGGFQSMAREAFLEKRVAAAEAAAERAREELLGACAREQAARGRRGARAGARGAAAGALRIFLLHVSCAAWYNWETPRMYHNGHWDCIWVVGHMLSWTMGATQPVSRSMLCCLYSESEG